MSRARRKIKCQECGEMVYPDQVHDYQKCLEYKLNLVTEERDVVKLVAYNQSETIVDLREGMLKARKDAKEEHRKLFMLNQTLKAKSEQWRKREKKFKDEINKLEKEVREYKAETKRLKKLEDTRTVVKPKSDSGVGLGETEAANRVPPRNCPRCNNIPRLNINGWVCDDCGILVAREDGTWD